MTGAFALSALWILFSRVPPAETTGGARRAISQLASAPPITARLNASAVFTESS